MNNPRSLLAERLVALAGDIEQFHDIGCVALHWDAVLGVADVQRRLPETPQIGSDHVYLVRECLDLRLPHLPVERETVNEQHRSSAPALFIRHCKII